MLTLGRGYLQTLIVVDQSSNHIILVISCQDRRAALSPCQIGIEATAKYTIYRREVLERYVAEKRIEPPTWDGQGRGLPAPWLASEAEERAARVRAIDVEARARRKVMGQGRRA